jgi:hypothetical protein
MTMISAAEQQAQRERALTAWITSVSDKISSFLSFRDGDMSLTMELLRMETAAEPDLFWTQHRLHQPFLVLGNEDLKSAAVDAAAAPNDTATAKNGAVVNCAKVMAEASHSYCT